MQKEELARAISLSQRMEKEARLLQRRKLLVGKPWYILHPESALVSIRDAISMVALVLLYFVLPFEIAFVDAPSPALRRRGRIGLRPCAGSRPSVHQ